MTVKTKKGIIEKAFKIVFMNNYETATIDVAILVRDAGEIVKLDVPIEDIRLIDADVLFYEVKEEFPKK